MMVLSRREFRTGLLDAARELSAPADRQIERHANGTPEQLVLEFDRLDTRVNNGHLTQREAELLRAIENIVDGFNPNARESNLWFDNEWMRDPCWDPVRALAAALAAELERGFN